MVDSYEWLRLRAEGRDASGLVEQLRQRTLPEWAQAGARCWGIWQGLFGVASNELFVMAAAPGRLAEMNLEPALPGGAGVVDSLSLLSTVRPTAIDGLPAEGLYVFRFFEVRTADCDEIIALSAEAWETFENTDRYASRPRGLFRPRGREDTGRMLLVTWYDGFASWESSRRPAPEALENFRRRHALTLATVAFGTRLVGVMD